MVKATDVVYKYNEGEFAVKHKKDGFKANSTRVLIGYTIAAKNTAQAEQPILPRFIFGFAVAHSLGKEQSRH